MWESKSGYWGQVRQKFNLGQEPKKRHTRPATVIRRRKVAEAIARACVLADPMAYKQPEVVKGFWSHPDRPPSKYDLRIVGGMRGARKRMTEPDFTLDLAGPLNPEFVFGLIAARALIRSPGDRYRVYLKRRIAEEFVEDLKALGVPFKASSRKGYVRISRCPFIFWNNCPGGKATRSIMAGLLSGDDIVEDNYIKWLEIPNNVLTSGYLDQMTIPYKRVRGDKKLRVSPYFGILFSPHMPAHMAARLLAITKPVGDCPLLPAYYYDWVMGSKPYAGTIPSATTLPFGCGYSTFYEKGYSRDGIMQARSQLRIVGFAEILNRLTRDWLEAYFELKGNGAVSHEQIREHIMAKHYPKPNQQAECATITPAPATQSPSP